MAHHIGMVSGHRLWPALLLTVPHRRAAPADSWLFEQAEIARYSDLERRWYFESQKEYWDSYSIMTTALNKGRAEGRKEGLAEGEAKGRAKGRDERSLEIAR